MRNLGPQAGRGAETVGLSCWRPDHEILNNLHCTKQREQPFGEGLIVGVDVQVFVHVVEGQLAVVIVEVDAHLTGDQAGWQGGEGDRQGFKLSAPLQPQGHVPGASVQRLEAFPQRRLFGHAQPPVALADLRLPVVAAGAQAVHANGAPPPVETLVEVGNIFPLEAAAHPLLVNRDEQVWIGCVQIQSYLHFGWEGRRFEYQDDS